MQAKVETSIALGPVTYEDSAMKRLCFNEEQTAYALKQAELQRRSSVSGLSCVHRFNSFHDSRSITAATSGMS
jgi:hypothetical protein